MSEPAFIERFIEDSTVGFAYLLGIGIPALIVYCVKDFVANIASYFFIKGKSTFQLHNDFEVRGRKRCRVIEFHLTQVKIQDVESRQVLRIFNKDFIKLNIWENPVDLPKNND